MPLIPCPHCGKQISDTSGKCIHCGESLIQEVEKQNYNKLTDKEKADLREEFYKFYPEYKNCNIKKQKRLKHSAIIGFMGFGCGIVMLLMYLVNFLSGKKLFSSNNIFLFIGVSVMVLTFIFLITFFIMTLIRHSKDKKYQRNEIIIEKKFQKWLLENKNIEYPVAVNLEGNDRAFFNSIDINKIDIER